MSGFCSELRLSATALTVMFMDKNVTVDALDAYVAVIPCERVEIDLSDRFCRVSKARARRASCRWIGARSSGLETRPRRGAGR